MKYIVISSLMLSGHALWAQTGCQFSGNLSPCDTGSFTISVSLPANAESIWWEPSGLYLQVAEVIDPTTVVVHLDTAVSEELIVYYSIYNPDWGTYDDYYCVALI